jgi:hypothetical protein
VTWRPLNEEERKLENKDLICYKINKIFIISGMKNKIELTSK